MLLFLFSTKAVHRVVCIIKSVNGSLSTKDWWEMTNPVHLHPPLLFLPFPEFIKKEQSGTGSVEQSRIGSMEEKGVMTSSGFNAVVLQCPPLSSPSLALLYMFFSLSLLQRRFWLSWNKMLQKFSKQKHRFLNSWRSIQIPQKQEIGRGCWRT